MVIFDTIFKATKVCSVRFYLPLCFLKVYFSQLLKINILSLLQLDSATSLIQAAKNLMNAVVLTVKSSYVASTKYPRQGTIAVSYSYILVIIMQDKLCQILECNINYHLYIKQR
jgi:hypothetical protein